MSTTAHQDPPALTPEVLTEDDHICPECPHLISKHEEDDDGVLYCSECDCAIEVDEDDDNAGDGFDDLDDEDDDLFDDDDEDDMFDEDDEDDDGVIK